MHNVDIIRQKFAALTPFMNEQMRRLWAAAEATALGRGGVAAVSEATGLSRVTIAVGIAEQRRQATGEAVPPLRGLRRPGGGRKRVTHTDRTLLRALESLVDPVTRGDPQSPLRWTCKSTRNLAAALKALGHQVGDRTVARLLQDVGYSLQANRKTKEGTSHPDRDAQFQYINEQTKAFQRRGQPVVSVDTKKKELVGEFKNSGREWQPRALPERVRVHDFEDKVLGKAIPYGIYDVTANTGWVSVGTDHDTAAFAVETLRRWWQQMGASTYPAATELLVIADGGGSNGSRTRLWKAELQGLADELGMRIAVCHLPPGTSKWNKIEHRMFAYITQNWRGKPLVSHEVIVNLIGSTTTNTGLTIRAALDPGRYATGRKIPDAAFADLQVKRDPFHGEWNYTIVPREPVN
jgi:Rhodopirellula transposase DDE domain